MDINYFRYGQVVGTAAYALELCYDASDHQSASFSTSANLQYWARDASRIRLPCVAGSPWYTNGVLGVS